VFDLQPRQGIFEATGDEVGGSCPFDAVQYQRQLARPTASTKGELKATAKIKN
jgi:hypothetical protein